MYAWDKTLHIRKQSDNIPRTFDSTSLSYLKKTNTQGLVNKQVTFRAGSGWKNLSEWKDMGYYLRLPAVILKRSVGNGGEGIIHFELFRQRLYIILEDANVSGSRGISTPNGGGNAATVACTTEIKECNIRKEDCEFRRSLPRTKPIPIRNHLYSITAHTPHTMPCQSNQPPLPDVVLVRRRASLSAGR